MESTQVGEHAVVLGAGMAGLLAARVLSDFYGAVTVVERDELPEEPAQRRGIPQGRHVHAITSGGSQILGQLFPGLLEELVADGAQVWDDGDLSRICFRVGGHAFKRSGHLADPAASATYLASRPFLEAHVRRRVRAIDNVVVRDGHDAVAAITAPSGRVTGVHVADRGTGDRVALQAELVVDAMGRGAFTPALLERLGYDRPVEQRSSTRVLYASQMLKIPAGAVTEKLTLVVPGGGQPTGGGVVVCEHDTLIVTISGVNGYQPPTDLSGILDAAAQFAPPSVLAAVYQTSPVGEVATYHYPGSMWRHYDQMSRFPAGLLPFGDAIASFNPSYGQGMTMAALQAIAMQESLSSGDTDLPARFFTAAATPLAMVWQANRATGETAAATHRTQHLHHSNRRRQLQRRLTSWWMNRILDAVETDLPTAEAVFRVRNFTAAPATLQDPRFHARVALTALRGGLLGRTTPDHSTVHEHRNVTNSDRSR